MSTLSVSSIQNTASPTTNIVVNADGSVTLGLYRTPSVAPTPVQIGTLWYDIGGAGLVIWNGSSWAGVGGGGGGTVTGVTATLPMVSTGGTAPVISIGLGLGTVVNGSNIAVSIPVASTPPGIGTGATQGLNGSMYWDDTLGQLFIRYANGASPVWVAAAPPAGGGGAGTVTTVTGTAPIAVATGSTTPVVSITPGTARQLMQTNAGGTAAEFASNIDVPGTLDVTGVGTFDGDLKFNSGYGSAVTAYGCRAWVNFNGVSGVIRSSGNVSSVTVISTGNYTISFTIPLPDTNYSAILTVDQADPGGELITANTADYTTPRTTSSLRVACAQPTVGVKNTLIFQAAIFR